MKKKPIKAELPWRRVGNQYVVTNPQTKQSVVLDPISWMVWIQCDGKIDVEQIVDVFSVNGNRDIIKTAVLSILKRLTQLELIGWI